MLFIFKSYVRFLWKSTNQHGVHSPFVYDLVTRCFYDRKKRASYALIRSIYKKTTPEISFKHAKLFHRLLPYLGYKKVLISESTTTFLTELLSINTSLSIVYNPGEINRADFIYTNIAALRETPTLIDTLFSLIHNDSLLLIGGIHTSRENQFFWEQIKKHHLTKVTIDTFNFGFIFFRKEQVKEHFIIRL